MTTRQKIKIRNVFANNALGDTKLSTAQLSIIIQSGAFLGNIIGKLGKEVLMKFLVPLAKDIFPQLATRATLYHIIWGKKSVKV